MEVKKISDDLYDYSAYMDQKYGAPGTPQGDTFLEEANNYMLGTILRDEATGRPIEIVDSYAV